MPKFVSRALEKRGLMDAFNKRPPYQRNDYIGWIKNGADKKDQEIRLSQMLDELERGGIYRGRAWRSAKKGEWNILQ